MRSRGKLLASVLCLLAIVSCAISLTGCDLVKEYLCDHTWGEWTVVTDATCINEGVRERACTKCGVVAVGTLQMAPHTPSEDDGDCTTEVTCSVCGAIAIEATDHTGGTATCTSKANCSTCGKEYGELAEHKGETLWMKRLDSHYLVFSCCYTPASEAEGHAKVDGVCTVCGFNPTVTATSAEVIQGDAQVEIVLSISDNPGIIGLTATVQYSSDVFTLTDARSGAALSTLAFTAPSEYKSGCTFLWDGVDIKDENIKDGELLVLTFAVAENAPEGEYSILLNLKAYDNDLNPVSLLIKGGKIAIKNG